MREPKRCPASLYTGVLVFFACMVAFAVSEGFGAVFASLVSAMGFAWFAVGFARISRSVLWHVAKGAFGYLSLVVAFGGAYIALANTGVTRLNVWELYYYSFSVQATLSGGGMDATAFSSTSALRVVNVTQVMVALFYGVLVLGTLLSQKGREPDCKRQR